jgi:hypothetical protein
MKIFDDTSFGWALVAVALFLVATQVLRFVMKLLWG